MLCGTPLAEADEWDLTAELPPLPPLPDGGLSVSMPAWLRAVPDAPEPVLVQAAALPIPEEVVVAATVPAEHGVVEPDLVLETDSGEPEPAEDRTPGDQPLGPEADPRTFLRDDDFPRWIRELPALPPRPIVQSTAPFAPVLAAEPQSAPSAPSLDRDIPSTPLADLALPEQEAPQQERHGIAKTAGPPQTTQPSALPVTTPPGLPRRREPWEAPLMVVLVVGVIAAVIWALLANGLIGRGL